MLLLGSVWSFMSQTDLRIFSTYFNQINVELVFSLLIKTCMLHAGFLSSTVLWTGLHGSPRPTLNTASHSASGHRRCFHCAHKESKIQSYRNAKTQLSEVECYLFALDMQHFLTTTRSFSQTLQTSVRRHRYFSIFGLAPLLLVLPKEGRAGKQIQSKSVETCQQLDQLFGA